MFSKKLHKRIAHLEAEIESLKNKYEESDVSIVGYTAYGDRHVLPVHKGDFGPFVYDTEEIPVTVGPNGGFLYADGYDIKPSNLIRWTNHIGKVDTETVIRDDHPEVISIQSGNCIKKYLLNEDMNITYYDLDDTKKESAIRVCIPAGTTLVSKDNGTIEYEDKDENIITLRLV